MGSDITNDSRRAEVTPEGDLVIDPVVIWDSKNFACWVNKTNRALYSVGK